MPKGPKGQKRPVDVIGKAVKVMRIVTGEEQEDFTADDGKDPAAKSLGSRGGKARAKALSGKQLREIAKRAAPLGGSRVLAARATTGKVLARDGCVVFRRGGVVRPTTCKQKSPRTALAAGGLDGVYVADSPQAPRWLASWITASQQWNAHSSWRRRAHAPPSRRLECA
jgi:hypothetical protein